MTTGSAARLAVIPVVDVRDEGPVHYATEARARARTLRDQCIDWLPRVAAEPVAGHGRGHSPLAPAIAFALCGGGPCHCGQSRLSWHLVSQWLLSVGLYCARLRTRWRAVACADARLAVSGARPWPGNRADAGHRGRFRQRNMARLCRSPDSVSARAFRCVHQSGSDVAANPAALATDL